MDNQQETKSTHKAEIVPIALFPHPNPKAKALSIVKVFGYTVVVRTKDWAEYIESCIPVETPIAVFIQPDSIVPEVEDIANCPWKYLGKPIVDSEGISIGFEPLTPDERRIKTRRFLGTYSEGILIPVPLKYWSHLPSEVIESSERESGIQGEVFNDFLIGQDLADFIGITHYEPKEKNSNGPNSKHESMVKGPSIKIPEYDLENWYRHGSQLFKDGDPVVITEKIHGTNARFVYSSRDKNFFIGSHHAWKRDSYVIPWKAGWIGKALVFLGLKKDTIVLSNSYWARIGRHSGVKELCIKYPNYVVYGEIYGDVQNLKYGCGENEIRFRVFDIYNQNTEEYLPYHSVRDLCSDYGLETVQELYYGPYSEAKVRELVSGASETFNSVHRGDKHLREGIVIQSLEENGLLAGKSRAKLKAVSSEYLEKN